MLFNKIITYDNFDFSNSAFSVNAIIWGLCIGLSVGVVAYILSKHFSNRIVKAIVKAGCDSKEKAKSAEDLGLKAGKALSKRLCDSKTIRKYVFIANADECRIESKKGFIASIRKLLSMPEAPARYDTEKALIYIPEEKRYTAEVRYEEKGSPILIAIIFPIIFIIVAVLLSTYFPNLLKLCDDAINAFKKI